MQSNLNPEAKMDPLTKNLIVEVARTVLRVLGEAPAQPGNLPGNAPVPTPWNTTVNTEADKGRAKPAPAPAAPRSIERGDTVRVWTGDRYEYGAVDAIGRDKVTCIVRISKGEGRRDKLVRAHREKLTRA